MLTTSVKLLLLEAHDRGMHSDWWDLNGGAITELRREVWRYSSPVKGPTGKIHSNNWICQAFMKTHVATNSYCSCAKPCMRLGCRRILVFSFLLLRWIEFGIQSQFKSPTSPPKICQPADIALTYSWRLKSSHRNFVYVAATLAVCPFFKADSVLCRLTCCVEKHMQADESKVQLFWLLVFLLLISPPFFPSGWITALCFEHTIMQHGCGRRVLKKTHNHPKSLLLFLFFFSPPLSVPCYWHTGMSAVTAKPLTALNHLWSVDRSLWKTDQR